MKIKLSFFCFVFTICMGADWFLQHHLAGSRDVREDTLASSSEETKEVAGITGRMLNHTQYLTP
jgi:hypothetical protein